MNFLSWAIIAIDVVASFDFFLKGFLTLSLITIVVAALVAGLSFGESINEYKNEKEQKEYVRLYKTSMKWVGRGIGVFLCSALLSILIPEKQTMYLVLSSEVSERVLKTPEIERLWGSGLELLEQRLEAELEDLTTKEK